MGKLFKLFKACGGRVANIAQGKKSSLGGKSLFLFLLLSNHPGTPPRTPNWKPARKGAVSWGSQNQSRTWRSGRWLGSGRGCQASGTRWPWILQFPLQHPGECPLVTRRNSYLFLDRTPASAHAPSSSQPHLTASLYFSPLLSFLQSGTQGGG